MGTLRLYCLLGSAVAALGISHGDLAALVAAIVVEVLKWVR